MKRNCSTCICKEGSCYPSTTIFDKDKTCKSYVPDYEGYIAELEKENAELKKNYEDSLVACGVLEKRMDYLSKPSPVEAMQDALITTQKVVNEKQKGQLTKAKELLAKWVELYKPKSDTALPTPIQVVTEQFLSEVEK